MCQNDTRNTHYPYSEPRHLPNYKLGGYIFGDGQKRNRPVKYAGATVDQMRSVQAAPNLHRTNRQRNFLDGCMGLLENTVLLFFTFSIEAAVNLKKCHCSKIQITRVYIWRNPPVPPQYPPRVLL